MAQIIVTHLNRKLILRWWLMQLHRHVWEHKLRYLLNDWGWLLLWLSLRQQWGLFTLRLFNMDLDYLSVRWLLFWWLTFLFLSLF